MSQRPANFRFPAIDEITMAARPLPRMPSSWRNLVKALVAQSRRTPDKLFAIDETDGSTITFKELVQKSTALAGPIQRLIGKKLNVGILMPPSIYGAVANVAVVMSGNVAVNLNLLSEQIANNVIADAGITHVITSRKVMEKLKHPTLNAKLMFLEDMAGEVHMGDKARAGAVASLSPLTGMSEILAGAKFRLRDTATLLYTSGTEGVGKGVELSHKNILINIWQIKHHVAVKDYWKVLGVLPFFHMFGFTVTLWAVAVLGLTVVFSVNGKDGRVVGQIVEKHGINMAACIPTVARLWLPRMKGEQFGTMEMFLFGAEKLKPELAKDIADKLGIVPDEGYGTTECGVISSNAPNPLTTADGREVDGNVLGTVGVLLPGTAIAVLDIDTFELLPPGNDGHIFVRGPQVMKGYFGKPAETQAVLHDGWYYTGDVGNVNADGRITLTDRMNRIIKMGGEWVPLMRIEAAIREVTGCTELEVISTGVPDDVKGERPVVLFTDLKMEPSELCKRLSNTGLPPLWVPKVKDFFPVENMPLGTTGKLDLKEVKRQALAFLSQ